MEEMIMREYVKIAIKATVVTALALTLLSSCKKESPVTPPSQTSAPDGTEILGCGNNHNYVDGYCTECGKQQDAEFKSELEYTLSDDGTYYTVSGIGSITGTEIVIPENYKGKPVTAIGDAAFQYNRQITSVTIPEGITSIGSNAFQGCNALTAINLPKSLETIGRYAFHKCTSVSGELRIPNKITVIQEGAFGECERITALILPSEVTHIGADAFAKLKYVRELSIPKTLVHVGENAFKGCRIESVNITDFNAWCNIEFESLQSNPMVNLYGDDNGAQLLINGVAATAYAMGDEIKAIKDYTFAGCSSLISVTFSKNLEYIGDGAFCCCPKLQTAILPDSLTYLGKSAFANCVSLTNVKLSSKLTEISEEAFSFCKALEAVEIPNSVSIIGKQAFKTCMKLEHIIIPDSVTVIGEEAFGTCILLETVTLGNNVKTIMPRAFHDCRALTAISLPCSVETIGEYAFSYCISLKSTALPNSIKKIGRSTFEKCYALTDIVFNGKRSEWDAIDKGDEWCANTSNLSVKCIDSTEILNRASTGLKYNNAVGSNNELVVAGIGTCTDTEIFIPATHEGKHVVGIEAECFKNVKGITKIVIPDSVKDIYPNAFYGCKDLKEVVLGSGAEWLEALFVGCTSLEKVTIPNGVKFISVSCFNGCTALRSITIPSTVSEFHENAFSKCSSLTDIYFNGTKVQFNNITKASTWIADTPLQTVHCSDGDLSYVEFTNSSDLSFRLSLSGTYYSVVGRGNANGSIIIIPAEYNGKPVKEIGYNAFQNDTNLKTVIISEGITSIGERAFYASGVTDITIPSTLKSVGNNAFALTFVRIVRISSIEDWCKISFNSFQSKPASGNTRLILNGEDVTKFEISDSITSIGNYQFAGFSEITEVKLGSNVISIGDYAFYGCTSLSQFRIPDSVTHLGKQAFNYCSSLTEIIIPSGIRQLNGQFVSCTNLKRICIPADFSGITSGTFEYCPQLNEIIYCGAAARWTKVLNAGFSAELPVYKAYCIGGIINHGTVSQIHQLDLQQSEDGTHYVVMGKGGSTDSGIIIDSTYNDLPVTEIASGAFEGESHSLVYICDGIETIGKNAFKDCKDTAYVRLPKTLKSIGDGAFDGIDPSARIVFNGTLAAWNNINGSSNVRNVVCTDGTAE